MATTSPPQPSRETFTGLVRVALQNLDSPMGLQTSHLMPALVQNMSSHRLGSEALREILIEAIDSLRPKADIPLLHPECRGYHLLRLRYVEHKSRYAVCDALSISQSSYYRCRRQALEALSAVLWQRFYGAHEPLILPPLADEEAALQEALHIARAGRRQSVDLVDLLKSAVDTIHPLLEQEQVTLCYEPGELTLVAYADPGILRQIALDILINGMDMMHMGSVALSVHTCADRALWSLSCERGTRSLDLTVDSERFAFGRELLAVYGGSLSLFQDETTLGVHFEIPLVRPRTVLIIDDSEDTIRLYSRWLRAHGLMVRIAKDEQELQSQLGRQMPDLILLDVLMPHWDGWMALQDLKGREETRHIPVVISSVLSRPRLAVALGASRVLTKPISEDELVEAIHALLNREDTVA